MNNYNHFNDWFHESNISKQLVKYLKLTEYSILKDNSDNIKARGVDIIATKDGYIEIIEVKGYPTTFHTKGFNKGLPKPTNPKLQAKHWFSEAILSSIFNYKNYKESRNLIICIALPLNERYLELITKVEDYFTDHNLSLKIYFVDEDGEVIMNNLNKNKR